MTHVQNIERKGACQINYTTSEGDTSSFRCASEMADWIMSHARDSGLTTERPVSTPTGRTRPLDDSTLLALLKAATDDSEAVQVMANHIERGGRIKASILLATPWANNTYDCQVLHERALRILT